MSNSRSDLSHYWVSYLIIFRIDCIFLDCYIYHRVIYEDAEILLADFDRGVNAALKRKGVKI